MNRSFWYLLLATILVLLTVFFIDQRGSGSHNNSARSALLMPDLHKVINEVDQVKVVTAGNTVVATLNKSGEQWQVEQMNGYAANWPTLKKALSALAQAHIIEMKTDKPEYYSRLGVSDITSEDAGGVMLELSEDGKTQSVIVGQRAKSRSGQYVRLQGSTASALVDKSLDVPVNLLAWVDKRIVDINASEVAQVEVIHPDKQRVLIMRISADQKDFDLAGKPFDRELRSTWAVNSMAATLSLLDLQSVRPAAKDDDWSDAVKMRVLLFSGVEIIADLIASGDEYLLRLEASKPKSDYETLIDDKDKAQVETAEAAVMQQVADINQRVNGWVYLIPQTKFEAMVKKPEDLLKPLAQEQE
jgi:hypothetical protein